LDNCHKIKHLSIIRGWFDEYQDKFAMGLLINDKPAGKVLICLGTKSVVLKKINNDPFFGNAPTESIRQPGPKKPPWILFSDSLYSTKFKYN
jgi:hypothetical protein